MEKQELITKTKDALSPFETKNVIKFLQNLTLKSAMENPWIIGGFLIIFFYAVFKRSKFVLLALFSVIAVMLLVRFAFPPAGEELSLSSTLPFVLGGLVIGGVLLYFNFVKTE
ncbi:MAG TPA: hypothetical protein PLI53_03675 [Geobacteraceae bacterium]|nr:hypothetical protein [Geobacteraceae bacterium]